MPNFRFRFSLFLILALCTSIPLQAQKAKFFDGTIEEAQAAASQSGQFLFVDAYTTWCKPCKMMDKLTFTDTRVVQYMNKHFIAFKLDIEKGEGIGFAQKHKITSIPTLMFFSHNGELLHRASGARQPKGFMELCENAVDEKKQFRTLEKRFEKGDRDPKFLQHYAQMSMEAGLEPNSIMDAWMEAVGGGKMVSQEVLEIFYTMEDPHGKFYNYVVAHQEQFAMVEGWTLAAISFAINDSYMMEIERTLATEDAEERIAVLKKKVEAELPSYYPEYEIMIDFIRFRHDKKKSHNYTAAYLDHHCSSMDLLNEVAWEYFENEKSKKRLEAALRWIDRSIELDKNYYNTDTKVALLMKLKRYGEAKEWAETSISIGKKDGEDVSETEKLLKKIEGKLK